MIMANTLKITAITAITLWLVGCASPGEQGQQTESPVLEPIVTDMIEEDIIEPQPMVDPIAPIPADYSSVNATPEQIVQFLEDTTYHFAFDSFQINEQDYQALNVKAIYLTSPEGRSKRVTIEGHTDERGTRTYNLALGERRANAVKDYLVARGVGADRIDITSFGFEKPLDEAHNNTAWAKNRRAVVNMH